MCSSLLGSQIQALDIIWIRIQLQKYAGDQSRNSRNDENPDPGAILYRFPDPRKHGFRPKFNIAYGSWPNNFRGPYQGTIIRIRHDKGPDIELKHDKNPNPGCIRERDLNPGISIMDLD